MKDWINAFRIEQRSPAALALPPTPEIVRRSGKEGRA
jgi:hypothetical protein